MPIKKRCPFCEKNSPEIHFTKEHILRNKFNKLLPNTPNKTVWKNILNDKSGLQITNKTLAIPESPFDATVNSICNECNEGWMNSLENEVEVALTNIIFDKDKYLSSKASISLATWGAKTAAVLALKHRDHAVAIPPEHYAYIKNNILPPPHSHIWVARTDYNINTMSRYGRHSYGEPGNGISFHLTTINIGHFAVFILGARNQEIEMALFSELAARDSIGLKRLWPAEAIASQEPIGGFYRHNQVMLLGSIGSQNNDLLDADDKLLGLFNTLRGC